MCDRVAYTLTDKLVYRVVLICLIVDYYYIHSTNTSYWIESIKLIINIQRPFNLEWIEIVEMLNIKSWSKQLGHLIHVNLMQKFEDMELKRSKIKLEDMYHKDIEPIKIR